MPLAAARVRMGGELSSVFVVLILVVQPPPTGTPWVGATLLLEVLFLEVKGVGLGVGVLTTVKGAGGTIGARGLVVVVVVLQLPLRVCFYYFINVTILRSIFIFRVVGCNNLCKTRFSVIGQITSIVFSLFLLTFVIKRYF